jgi:hypothetical protein
MPIIAVAPADGIDSSFSACCVTIYHSLASTCFLRGISDLLGKLSYNVSIEQVI